MSDVVVVNVPENPDVVLVNPGIMKGDKGDTGDTGPQGIQGIQGIQGQPGAASVAVVSPIANTGTPTNPTLKLDPAFGGFYDATSQDLVSTSSPQQVRIGATAYAHGMTRSNSGDITATVAGNYSFTYTALFGNSSTQIQYASLFIKFNGQTVPGTSTLITVPSSHGGTSGYALGGNTFIVPMGVGDTIQLWWAGSNTALKVHYVPEAGAIPAADSVLFSIRQIGSL